MKTQAAVLWGRGQDWKIEEVDLDPPKAHEVLVRWMAAGLCHSDEHLRASDMGSVIRATQPLQRQGLPGDVAQAVVYLASDRAAQVTGVVLPVDGGTSAGPPAGQMAAIVSGRTKDRG